MPLQLGAILGCTRWCQPRMPTRSNRFSLTFRAVPAGRATRRKLAVRGSGSSGACRDFRVRILCSFRIRAGQRYPVI